MGWQDVARKDLREMGNSWEALNRLGWRNMCSCFGLGQLCSEYLVVVNTTGSSLIKFLLFLFNSLIKV